MTARDDAREAWRQKQTPAHEAMSSTQFYHGTSHEFPEGHLIDPSQPHGKVHDVSMGGSAFFTSSLPGARFYASLAQEKSGGQGRVYQVEPTGAHHADFQTRRNPDNRMTSHPLKVIREVQQ